ncbi:MAG: hypothetical protein CMP59_03090 [Flavobacteriales bacterium]|nr:hypothetical protein [Flavobacteriales bacterium]|tara:strand:- start:101 stop:1168 length:1068 start_codon:yes stop_codon:yes gene_type:complete
MTSLSITLSILAILLSILSILPEIRITHWSVRALDFIRLQLLGIQIIVFVLIISLLDLDELLVEIALLLLSISIIRQLWIIAPYIAINKIVGYPKDAEHSIELISINVLQKNEDYQKTIELIREYQPDLVLTMETNRKWEKTLEEIEEDYPYQHKVPLENRYGMHLYSKLKVDKFESHFLISDERPSIQAHLVDKAGNEFIFWGVHPPPPSPTELPTSRQKDAELVKLAKMIREKKAMTVVAGDFNNVCWSLSSRLFSKISQLKDARFRNGIHPSFPVRPSLFRFPLDLMFNSRGIAINEIKTLRDIGSDHLPIYSRFTIESNRPKERKEIPKNLKEETSEIIEEGKQAAKEENV